MATNRRTNDKDDETYRLIRHNPSKSEELIALFGSRYDVVMRRITILNFQERRAEELLKQAELQLKKFDRRNIDAAFDLYEEMRSYFVESPANRHYRPVTVGRRRYYTLLDFETSPESLELIVLVNRVMNYGRIIDSTYERSIRTIKWGKTGGLQMIYGSFAKNGIPETTVARAHNTDIEELAEEGVND